MACFSHRIMANSKHYASCIVLPAAAMRCNCVFASPSPPPPHTNSPNSRPKSFRSRFQHAASTLWQPVRKNKTGEINHSVTSTLRTPNYMPYHPSVGHGGSISTQCAPFVAYAMHPMHSLPLSRSHIGTRGGPASAEIRNSKKSRYNEI